MGEEERPINLSLTWPGLQHPNANGSNGNSCGRSHKLAQVLFQLARVCKFSATEFYFFPLISAHMSELVISALFMAIHPCQTLGFRLLPVVQFSSVKSSIGEESQYQ